MCLAQGQHSDSGKPQTLGLESSTLSLSHCAPPGFWSTRFREFGELKIRVVTELIPALPFNVINDFWQDSAKDNPIHTKNVLSKKGKQC